MRSYDWASFTLSIPVNASPKAIYEAWTTPAGLESWFLRKATFQKPDGRERHKNEAIGAGDQYTWLWQGYGDEVVESHPVVLVNGWDTLQFRFSGDCVVTVKVHQEGSSTLCTITQDMPMDNEEMRRYYYVECGRGWTFYLANLKSILEGGIDLRNRNLLLSGKVIS